MNQSTLQESLQNCLEDAKAVDIKLINMEGKSALTDCLAIASGTSSRHVISIANKLMEQIKPLVKGSVKSEGMDKGDWVVLDFGDAVVHIFRTEVRSFYKLDDLWDNDSQSDDKPASTTKIQL